MVKVLLVDDSVAIQQSFGALLTNAPEVEIVGYAEDTATAVASIASNQPDLIVLDVKLRGHDRGIDVLRHVRQHYPGIKVVVLSQFNWTSMWLLRMDVPRWFGADWFGLDLPRHLTHFTPATLRALLERAGFAQIELHPQTRAGWIRHSAELAQRRGRDGAWVRVLKTRWGSKLMGRWARLIGAAETLVAVAFKTA